MNTHQTLLFVASFGLHLTLFGQPLLTNNKLTNRVDTAVHQAATGYLQQPGAVGLSIGIYQNGQTYTYHYGEVKKGTGQLPTASTFYNVGSVAKTFVGIMLAQAVVDKKAKLKDDIRKYLPAKYSNLTYQGHPIQLVHLANHTSGLPTSAKSYPTYVRDSLSKLDLISQVEFYGRYNQDSLLKDLHFLKVDTLPGTAYKYNSGAMMVLTLLLERIYQQPYEKLVTNYLQSHLGMYDTKVQLSVADTKRTAQGYDRNNQPQSYVNLKGFYVGPSMNSTVGDMLKYVRANLAEHDQAIKLSHQLTWQKSETFALGLGWMINTDPNGERCVYHSGNTKIGFNTLFTTYPDENTGFIVIVNDILSQDRVSELEQSIRQNLR